MDKIQKPSNSASGLSLIPPQETKRKERKKKERNRGSTTLPANICQTIPLNFPEDDT
jgi:hypothetical protein